MLKMAGLARSNSVNDSIKERRLRPIYELLDSGSNKKVIQEADRLLKKQPNFSCVKVLKALALLRIGKKAECQLIVMQIYNEVPVDENTIQAMAICFRELEKPDMVCSLMENAIKKDKSEDLLTFAYMAQVRVMDFQKQHQTAMALYKAYPKIPYFSWAVMSLFVKALYDDPKLAQSVTLPLAERMMAKFIEDGNIESEHEITLYTLILLKQENYEKALKVLEAVPNSGAQWTRDLFATLMIRCLKSTKEYEKLASFFERTIRQKLDELNYVEMYVDACGEMYKDRVASFLKELSHEHLPAEVFSRPALVAQFIHYNKIAKLNLDTTGLSVRDPLHLNIKKFLHRPSFIHEVKKYLKYLTLEEQKEMSDQAISKLQESVSECCMSLNYIQQYANTTAMKYYFNRQNILSDPFNVVDCVTEFTNLYRLVREQFLKANFQFDHRENYPYEEYMVMASVTLLKTFYNQRKFWHGFYLNNDLKRFRIEEANETNNTTSSATNVNVIGSGAGDTDVATKDSESFNGVLPVSICHPTFNLPEDDFAVLLNLSLLEYGLKHSPCSAPLRVLLGRSYSSCGAIVAGNDQFMRLDIKHAQIESLGYLYIWKALTCGVFTDAVRVANHVELFYNNHYKESMEHVISAYKYGSWEKILQFMKFRQTVIDSVQWNLLKVEKHLLEYTTDANSHDSCLRVCERDDMCFKDALEKTFTDSRDFRIHEHIVEESVSFELVELTHKDLLERLIIRSIYLNIINNLVRASQYSSEDVHYNLYLENVRGALQHIRDKIMNQDYDEFQEEYSKRCFYGPWPPSIQDYVGTGFFEFFFEFSQVVYNAARDNGKSVTADVLAALSNKLDACVMFFLEHWERVQFLLINFSNLLEEVFHVTQSLGYCVILADCLQGYISRGFKPKPETKNRKRKGKEQAADRCGCGALGVILETIRTNIMRVESVVADFKFAGGRWYPTIWTDLEPMWRGKLTDEMLDILQSSLPIVTDKLNTSYYRACAELGLNINLKLKYVEALLGKLC